MMTHSKRAGLPEQNNKNLHLNTTLFNENIEQDYLRSGHIGFADMSGLCRARETGILRRRHDRYHRNHSKSAVL